MDPFPEPKLEAPGKRRCQRVTSGRRLRHISGAAALAVTLAAAAAAAALADCLTAPRAGPSPASPASPAAAQRRRRPCAARCGSSRPPAAAKFLLAQISLQRQTGQYARLQPGLQPLLPTSATQAAHGGRNAGRSPVAQTPAVHARAAGRPGRPRAEAGSRQAADRGLEGRAPAGAGAGGVGSGLPAKGGAQFSPVCKPTEGCRGGEGSMRPGRAWRGARGAPPRRPLEQVGQHPRRRRLCLGCALFPCGHRRPRPLACPQGAASDKEGLGSLGVEEARPASPATRGPVSRLRARAVTGQTSPAPATLKAEQTLRAPGSRPRSLSSGERAARIRPGFEESRAAGREQRVGPRPAPAAWTRRPGALPT